MIDEKRKSVAVTAFRAHLKQKGLRLTSERKAVADRVLSIRGHFSADALHEDLLGEGFRLSRATVYNTLNLLKDCRVVERREGPGGGWRVRDGRAVHISLVCSACGRRREVRDTAIADLVTSRRFKSFVTAEADITLGGLCASCASKVSGK